MPKFSVTRRVPFTVDQVFAISADVGNYRQFVPLLKRSIVRNRRTLPDGREAFEADLVVAYRKLSIEETLTSQVVVDKEKRTVTATASEGPVKHLNSEWLITEVGPGQADISFTVDYQLKSRTLQFLLSGMFDMIVRRIMSAFEERAKFLYSGTPSAKS